jgi:hypothetical protein
MEGRASCDCGSEEGASGGDAGPVKQAGRVIRRLSFSSHRHFQFLPAERTRQLGCPIHCRQGLKPLTLLSFPGNAASRSDWGASFGTMPVVVSRWGWVWSTGAYPARFAFASSVPANRPDYLCHAPAVASRLAPRRLVLETVSSLFSLALVLMFQHSQQPAPPELNYHADLLGDPLVLFRVLVSLLSLQPRHSSMPDTRAHAHARAAAARFHPRHPVLTLLPHSTLLPRIPHLFLFSTLTLQALPVLLHSCAPLLTLLLRRDCMPARSRSSRSICTPLCTPPALPRRIDQFMISVSYPALPAPRASCSLGLLQLERFRSCSCFTFRRAYRM